MRGAQIAVGELLLRLGADVHDLLADGLRVVGRGVDDAVRQVVMRQVLVVIVRGEAEDEHAHAREAARAQQLAHLVGLHAQILRDERNGAERLLDGAEQLHAGALAPLAVHGGVLGRVDLPVGREAAEMVETDDVEQRHIALHAPDPPGVAGLFVRRPVIDRIAPELAGRGIVVGRHAGDELGAEVGLQLEQLGMRPDIGRVGGNIDRDVADDLDALLLCVRTQGVPLSEEDILEENAEVDLAAQLLGHSCERLRPAVADVLLRPHIDRRMVIFLLLERHEQRVIGQPFAVLLGEVRDFRLHLGRDARIRLAEQRPARIGELLEVRHIGRGVEVAGAHLVRRQQAVLDEQVHVDQIRIARRRREALVRRVAEAGMTERQHLPVGLVRVREEVDEFAGRPAHRAYAVRRGQRGHVREHAAGTFEHIYLPFVSEAIPCAAFRAMPHS